MTNRENANTASFVDAHRVLLTQEEETTLFVMWRTSEGRVKDSFLTQIIRAYSPIVKSTLREFSGYRVDKDELVSEGLFALVEAAKRFDLSKGFRFSTFAKSWVRGVMLGFVTKNFFPVNLCTSHNKKKLFFSIRRMIAKSLKESGVFELNQALAEELSASHDVDIRDVYVIYEMIRKPPVSLTDPMHSEDPESLTRQDFVEDGTPTAEDIVMEEHRVNFQKRIINDVIKTVLDERETNIFEMQVLTHKDESMTLEQLGKKWSVSRERVRQIRNSAKKKVKDAVVERVLEMDMDSSDVL